MSQDVWNNIKHEPYAEAALEELREMHDLLLHPVDSLKLDLLDSYIQDHVMLYQYTDQDGVVHSAARWMIGYLRGTFD